MYAKARADSAGGDSSRPTPSLPPMNGYLVLKAFDHPRAACDPLSQYLIGAPDARSFRMCRLDRRLVAHMGCHLRAQTATCRSEEHTSELQSLMSTSYSVFCLQKKK